MVPPKHKSDQKAGLSSGLYTRGYSPLMFRVMLINLLAVVILAGGVLYVNQFRYELLQRTTANLEVQAEIIAAAIGEAAQGDEDIDSSVARPIINRLVGPTNVRARLFSTEEKLIIDSRFLSGENKVIAEPLPDPRDEQSLLQRFEESLYRAIDYFADQKEFPLQNEETGPNAFALPEVKKALEGMPETILRRQQDGLIVVNIALPIQRFRRVLGSLHISATTEDIEAIVRAEQFSIIRVFLYAFAVTLMLSFFLGRTLATPIRTLARAAVRVRRGIGKEVSLPEFSQRKDEIGDLSRALSDMTRALYNQIDAVERFAADVAHELKNPLTSMRSALETIKLTDKKEHKERLLAILEDDVQRLDRLISDISDASRLDAELTRSKMDPVDLEVLLKNMIHTYQQTSCAEGPLIEMKASDGKDYKVLGIEERLSQVWRNIIDNALTFTPQDKTIRLELSSNEKLITIRIEDEGQGLSKGAEDKIFKRFYSERPDHDDHHALSGGGGHSGLGLAISKQVVEAHGGTIHASNRMTDKEEILGARFEVRLPAMHRE
ncbi:stimulus-sensing domain-containing protein [Temperatibacter marinus]|uniref:histidine kinase n=1 Tax=Temperatibacter marinus TaxID=1456591 RepID=A0AA52HAT3_9PROT|nr:stimulus-sensing domain-containing protein [Temperatibacter marinus]WND03922.1 stimulus-sensing domain-containing protein [Temperatibacter marinus]